MNYKKSYFRRQHQEITVLTPKHIRKTPTPEEVEPFIKHRCRITKGPITGKQIAMIKKLAFDTVIFDYDRATQKWTATDFCYTSKPVKA